MVYRIKRQKNKYRVQIMIDGKRHSAVFSRLEDASRYKAEMIRMRELMRVGMEMPLKRILVIDASKEFMVYRFEQARRQEITIDTAKSDEKNLRLYILPYSAKWVLSMSKAHKWSELLEHVMTEHELSPASFNRIRSTIQALYSWAISKGIAQADPISQVPKKSEKQKTRVYQVWESVEECRRWLAGASVEGRGFDIAAHIFANTGVRSGEASAIQVKDIELDHDAKVGTIRICRIFAQGENKVVERTKAGVSEERYVPITRALYEKLMWHFRTTPFKSPNDFVICDSKGKLINPDRLLDMHYRVCDRQGLTRIPIHKIRHFFATLFRNSGGSESHLRDLLGHSSEVVTGQYGKKTKHAAKKKAIDGIAVIENDSDLKGLLQ